MTKVLNGAPSVLTADGARLLVSGPEQCDGRADTLTSGSVKTAIRSGINTPTKALVRKFARAKPAPMPIYIELLATLRYRPPVGDNWLHEIKLDF
jgi:hypothetical protein